MSHRVKIKLSIDDLRYLSKNGGLGRAKFDADTRFKFIVSGLYRHFDADGNLLYVGVTDNFLARNRGHSINAPWKDEIATIELEVCSKAIATGLERRIIADELPRYNLMHQPDEVKQRIIKDKQEREAREKERESARGDFELQRRLNPELFDCDDDFGSTKPTPNSWWQALADELLPLSVDGRIDAREVAFLTTMREWRVEPSALQTKWLGDIARRATRPLTRPLEKAF
jgi:hypothetical protein